MPSMHAVRIHSYGGSDVLVYEEAPKPVPGPGEVLIQIAATSVNPFDSAVRAGYMTHYFNHVLPLILGVDASGTVEAVGDGVTHVAPGDDVYARVGVYRDGSYADYVVVSATDVAAKPASLDHIHAAAIPHAAVTAWQALFEMAELQAGETVLINGAAGGVGHIAVQLAQWRGATVIGTASINLPFLKQLGVAQAIDYTSTPIESVAHDVDVVLDLVGGETQQRSWSVLRPGGILISTIQAPSAEVAAAHGVRHGFVSSAPPIAQVLTEVAGLVAAGKLKPEVSHVFPLQAVAEAQDLLQGHHTRGKIVIQVAS